MTKSAWGWVIFIVGLAAYHEGHCRELSLLHGAGLVLVVWGLMFVDDGS